MLVHISAGRFTRWTVQANRVLPKVSVEPKRRFKNWPAGLLHQHQQHAVSMKRNREAPAPIKQGWRYVIEKVWCLRIFQDQACQMNRITDRLNSIYGANPPRTVNNCCVALDDSVNCRIAPHYPAFIFSLSSKDLIAISMALTTSSPSVHRERPWHFAPRFHTLEDVKLSLQENEGRPQNEQRLHRYCQQLGHGKPKCRAPLPLW